MEETAAGPKQEERGPAPLAPPAGPFAAFSPLVRMQRVRRRQERIRTELARSRSGEHALPTWALVLILVLLVGGFAAFIALS